MLACKSAVTAAGGKRTLLAELPCILEPSRNESRGVLQHRSRLFMCCMCVGHSWELCGSVVNVRLSWMDPRSYRIELGRAL